MSEEATYTIGELAERAGVTPRTIRYYTAEGLLPRPDTRGQYARYRAEHLLRLQLIGQLKGAYLPLHEIRARREGLGVSELQALLAAEPSEPSPPPTSAAEYLAQVLGQPAPAARLAESPVGYQPAPSLLESVPAMRLPAPVPPVPAAASGGGEMVGPGGAGQAAPQAGRAGGLLGRLLPERKVGQAPAPAPPDETWRRIALAPGVELHIHEPVASAGRVERLISFARELFERGDG